MKKVSSGIAKIISLIAKRSVKGDINSTGSPWMYQPKLPKKAIELKKK